MQKRKAQGKKQRKQRKISRVVVFYFTKNHRLNIDDELLSISIQYAQNSKYCIPNKLYRNRKTPLLNTTMTITNTHMMNLLTNQNMREIDTLREKC